MYVLFHVVPVDVIETVQTTISTSCHWIWQCYLSLFYQYLFVTVSLNVNFTISCNTSKSDCVNAWCHLVWWYLYQWEVLFILYNWQVSFCCVKEMLHSKWLSGHWLVFMCSCFCVYWQMSSSLVVSVSIDRWHRVWLCLSLLTGDIESGCFWVHWQVT